MEDPLRARFPEVPARAGHYESFYLRAGHRSQPLAAWIRYTVHKRPGAEPRGSLWFTLFDGQVHSPLASKVTLPRPSTGAASFIEIGDSAFGPEAVTGRAGETSWDLRYKHREPPLYHLPRNWMYRARLPRTKTLSPYPAALFDGALAVGGRTIEVEGWRGVVGHNWGAEHAERWIWLHGIGFEGRGDDTWIDVAIGRLRLGRLTTPWIANGAISLDGVRQRLGGIERLRATKLSEASTGCEFVLPGDGTTVRGTVASEASNFVGWLYADPDGGEHNSLNCSISDMQLVVSRDGAPDLRLEAPGGASYELGVRETDHGVPIQPFPDG